MFCFRANIVPNHITAPHCRQTAAEFRLNKLKRNLLPGIGIQTGIVDPDTADFLFCRSYEYASSVLFGQKPQFCEFIHSKID